jgi:hypothetical protein
MQDVAEGSQHHAQQAVASSEMVDMMAYVTGGLEFVAAMEVAHRFPSCATIGDSSSNNDDNNSNNNNDNGTDQHHKLVRTQPGKVLFGVPLVGQHSNGIGERYALVHIHTSHAQ